MNDDAEQQHPAQANPGYAAGQLAAAFRTAAAHPDPETRRRGEERGRRWRAVLNGMANGLLTIGSRTPVAGLPAWVTPEVVRGGFATGEPSAGGPLLDFEIAAARRAGVPVERHALFGHFLSEEGLAHLYGLLDSGRYEVTVPEEAALLTVAWLVRAGEPDAALDLVEELAPFAGRLRFSPRPADRPAPRPDAVHRSTVADASAALARRRPSTAVETQREALAVWQPFGDELLLHWLEVTDEEGHVRVPGPADDRSWHARSAELLRRYRDLARRHTRCTKHLKPKENLGILRGALEETVAGRELGPRRLGLLRHAVASMVRRRGRPGSPEHTALRREQAAQCALPSHRALARVVLGRLSALPQDGGVTETAPAVAPVSAEEAAKTGVPEGAEIPPAVRRPVEAALSAPVGTLVERGVVPSAEVLAELVPQLVAATTAAAHPEPALRTLAAANYRAFRNRRSLLLLNLQRQVRVEELPWVRAVAVHRVDAGADEVAATALRVLGGLAVRAFPGTILPNPLIRELSVLARQAELGAPFVEELAADIFMGTFTPKFLAAARVAAELLGGGSLYERYYAIDYRAVRNLAVIEAGDAALRSHGARTSPGFAALCRQRAAQFEPGTGTGASGSWVAGNGTVIEQAQILTTHNLATLVHRVGIEPGADWAELALRCFETVCLLTGRVHHNPRPLGTIKDVAYAWRQMVFHLSLCEPQEQRRVLDRLTEETARRPWHVSGRLAPALTRLHRVMAGAPADTGTGRRLLGWSTGGHWFRPDPEPTGRKMPK
ncbi:hypothetical protein [Streptomyces barringtoniae]|uniref:hypothetical protein n=1 Tax=Streptomyces barringtoniae TaxID=2892029 RepID=UPI001E45EA6A|nr:hypothetical protein [Streptomyces barringtoniae]MCC5477121.1 hypothetical protein [Streptomyces barringtoniae]